MDHGPRHESDPARSWVWSQHWLDVLFLHWRVPPGDLRAQVPEPLVVATHEGTAWVSLVLFRLRVRPRWLPFVPGLSSLVEANLRTYVRHRDRPGIWFLSAHADNRWAIRIARLVTPMPYRYAPLHYQLDQGRSRYAAGDPPALTLAVTFRPCGPSEPVADGTLDAWLLERYRLFVGGRRGGLMQAQVAHPRWRTRDVDFSVSTNRLGEAAGLDLARDPDRSHYSSGVVARFGRFREVALGEAQLRST